MSNTNRVWPLVVTLMALVIASLQPAFAEHRSPAGAVYAMTNEIDENRIVVYDRAANGDLQFNRKYRTGGSGTGGEPLSNL